MFRVGDSVRVIARCRYEGYTGKVYQIHPNEVVVYIPNLGHLTFRYSEVKTI